jgi:hypothetical protein
VIERGSPLAAVVVFACSGLVGCHDAGKTDRGAAPASTGASAPADTVVKLVTLPRKIGDRWRGTRTSSTRISVEYWQSGEKIGTQESTRSEDYDRQIEVLGLVGGVPGKIRVHYDHYRSKEHTWDKPEREDAEFEGQTYVLEARDDGTAAVDASGKPVSKEEADALGALHPDLGEEDALVAALGAGPIHIGSQLKFDDKLLRALTGDNGGQLKSGTITASSERTVAGRKAVQFDFTAEVHKSEDSGLELTWHLRGNTVVGVAPAMMLSLSIAGSIDVSGRTKRDGEWVDMAGDGELKDERTVVPGP